MMNKMIAYAALISAVLCMCLLTNSQASAQDASESGLNQAAHTKIQTTSTATNSREEQATRSQLSAIASSEMGPLDLYSCPPNCSLNQNSIVGIPAGCEPAGPPACTSATYSCNCAGGRIKNLTQNL